jgi:hypothetical protein
MARSWRTLQDNTKKLVDSGSSIAKTVIYYGFIPALLYLGLTTEPKPNFGALLAGLRG